MFIRVDQQVLWLNISMTYTQGMNIGKCSKSLVSVKFDKNHWHLLLHFIVMLKDSEHCLGHVVHDYVQINLIWLVTLSIESMLERDDIGVIKFLHYLQFSILVPFILIHLLDGYLFTILVHSRLEHHTERPVTYNTVSVVSETCGLLILFPSTFVCFLIIHHF